MSYWKSGTWILKMHKSGESSEVIAKGTYNLDSRWKSATKTKVTYGKTKDGKSMVGDSYTATSRILWGAQRVIKAYWGSMSSSEKYFKVV